VSSKASQASASLLPFDQRVCFSIRVKARVRNTAHYRTASLPAGVKAS
jgi:hypothetical protein